MPVVKEGPNSRQNDQSPTAPPEVLAEVIAVPKPVAATLSKLWFHITASSHIGTNSSHTRCGFDITRLLYPSKALYPDSFSLYNVSKAYSGIGLKE